jgi:hypothetical protein
MGKVLIALVVIAALVIGLGFYLNWFSFAPKGGDTNTNVPITVDKEKIKSDVEKAKEKVKDLTEKGKDKVKDLTGKGKKSGAGDSEKAKDSTPTSQTKEKDQ